MKNEYKMSRAERGRADAIRSERTNEGRTMLLSFRMDNEEKHTEQTDSVEDAQVQTIIWWNYMGGQVYLNGERVTELEQIGEVCESVRRLLR